MKKKISMIMADWSWGYKRSLLTGSLVQLYYAIVYPFLTYGCMVWGSIYCSNIKPLGILQKRTIRIINFAKFDAHSSPLFAKLKIIKLHYVILLYSACFMYQYSNCNLPSASDSFFTAINTRYTYSNRLASKSIFAFPKIRTNYGKFNIEKSPIERVCMSYCKTFFRNLHCHNVIYSSHICLEEPFL